MKFSLLGEFGGSAEALMESGCRSFRRAIMRRYMQVPRTEADGAFNYSRSWSRRSLLIVGRFLKICPAVLFTQHGSDV